MVIINLVDRMKLLQKTISLLLVALVAGGVSANPSVNNPTIILVHGALLDSTIWSPVQSYLQNRNFNVVTINVPGRTDDGIDAKAVSLDLAAKKLCNIAALQHGPVILAGHSQAGAIITQATAECGKNIKALVYIAAVMPLNNESTFMLLSDADGNHFDQCVIADKNAGVYRININGPLKAMFMDDATPAQAKRAIATMTAEPMRIGDDVLHYNEADFKAIPKFYIKTTEDRIISPQTQDNYIRRVNLKKVYQISSGHSPFLTKPHQLGAYLVEIIDTVAKPQ
jgi:pimeloyl-ACP methyl ester carboxylesterase